MCIHIYIYIYIYTHIHIHIHTYYERKGLQPLNIPASQTDAYLGVGPRGSSHLGGTTCLTLLV